MKQTTKLLSSLLVSALVASSAFAEIRTWTDTSGRQVTASFIGLDGEDIILKTANSSEAATVDVLHRSIASRIKRN